MSVPRLAGIYCRLSYAPDGSLEKVERQEGDSRHLGEGLGWPISEAHIFCDNSRSAWQRNRKRPAWDRMLAAIEAGEIDAIIVYHGDRLIRQPWDLELLLNIAREKGIRLASPSGTRDLDNPDDQFILRIEAAQACKSSDDTSRRVRRGWAARAKKGHASGGGKRPFAFENLHTLRESEAKLLAEVAEMRLAGLSHGGAIRWMDERSTTSMGNRWASNPKALKQILLAPRTAGLVEHEGVLYESVWPPVLDPDRDRAREIWEDLKALYAKSSAENPYPGRERRYLLTNVAVCPSGHGLHTKPVGGRNRKNARLYWCRTPGCKTRVSRNVEHLDRYVTGRVVRRLNDPQLLEALHSEGGKPAVAAEIATLERRKATTKDQLENFADFPELDAGILARSLASFDKKIAEKRNQLATSERARLLRRMAGISEEAWEATPIDVRSATVAAVFRVTVLPATWRGPGFDPASVRLEPMET
jgi:DNA invertase Pin-like site-specific DNA recombinase